jgi:toxin ParE1/3/4
VATVVVWTDAALADLGSLQRWIARDAPATAHAYVRRLVLDLEARLLRQPKRGRSVPESPTSGVLQVLYGNYRVMYRLRPTQIQVLIIYHSARIFDPRLIHRIERSLDH